MLYFPKKEGDSVSESKLRDLSTDFAVKAIKLTETIHGHRSIVNQLERSATSIGANIREANYAHGKADFIAKLQIALKECYETEYWIEIFVKSDILGREAARGILYLMRHHPKNADFFHQHRQRTESLKDFHESHIL